MRSTAITGAMVETKNAARGGGGLVCEGAEDEGTSSFLGGAINTIGIGNHPHAGADTQREHTPNRGTGHAQETTVGSSLFLSRRLSLAKFRACANLQASRFSKTYLDAAKHQDDVL